jgi:hypothetical protein
MEFDGDHVDGRPTDIVKNLDEVAANCKPRAAGVFLFGEVVDTYVGRGGVAVVIGRDLFTLDEDNCVGAFADAGDALRLTGEFLCVQFAPEFFVLRVDEEVMHFHELACEFVKDGLEHVGGELLACCSAWCDDVACDVTICVDAGQYCLLCDGAYLGVAASIVQWAIVGCGRGFEDAQIGYSLRSMNLFERSGGRHIGQDGSR